MPFYHNRMIRYFAFDNLSDAGVINAVITRQGGVSPMPWASLNVGGTVGDDPDRVLENRKRTFNAFELPFESLYDVWQVHGTEVVCSYSPRAPDTPHLKGDTILTDRPGVTLFMRFADCVPIFLVDPTHKVAGLVHAGWKGTVNKIVKKAVNAMCEFYNSSPEDILAGIGPSICQDHYEVGPEVSKEVNDAFGHDAIQLLQQVNGVEGKHKFNLWQANALILEQTGVKNIEISGICTACNLSDWYSHRAENGQTGRFGALIAL